MANYIRHGKTTGATNGRKNCRRETRLRKIREAKRELEARAREKAAVEGGAPDQAKPNDKDQYNFTDPQSLIMPGSFVLWSGYGNKPAPKKCERTLPGQHSSCLPISGRS
jgi:hypothetical protein